MEREKTLSIKLGLSVKATCILTVSDDCLCFRNKLKLSGQQEAPKFATQKMATYGGSQRLYKENSLLSKMTHEVCISKHELKSPGACGQRALFAAILLCHHVNSTMARWRYICSSYFFRYIFFCHPAPKIGVANGTSKNVGLGKIWQDLEISEAFLVSLEVSFLHGLFLPFLSLETFYQRVSGSDFYLGSRHLGESRILPFITPKNGNRR